MKIRSFSVGSSSESGSEIVKQDFILEIMESLKSHFGQGSVNTGGSYPSFEMMDESLGTCYIGVAYIEEDDIIYIDKYYEDEDLDEMYASNIKIPFDRSNPEELSSKVISAVGELL